MLRGWAAAHSVTALYPKLNRMKGSPAPAAVRTIPLGNTLKGSTAAQIQILFRNDMEETTNEHQWTRIRCRGSDVHHQDFSSLLGGLYGLGLERLSPGE